MKLLKCVQEKQFLGENSPKDIKRRSQCWFRHKTERYMLDICYLCFSYALTCVSSLRARSVFIPRFAHAQGSIEL